MKCNKLFVASLSLALSLSASAVSAQQQLRGIAPSSSVLLEVEDSSSASGSWDSRDSISQDGIGDELELWSSGSGGQGWNGGHHKCQCECNHGDGWWTPGKEGSCNCWGHGCQGHKHHHCHPYKHGHQTKTHCHDHWHPYGHHGREHGYTNDDWGWPSGNSNWNGSWSQAQE